MVNHSLTKLPIEFDGLSADACAIISAGMNTIPKGEPSEHGEDIGRAVGIVLASIALSLGPRANAWRAAYERGLQAGVDQTIKAVTTTMVSQAGGLQ